VRASALLVLPQEFDLVVVQHGLMVGPSGTYWQQIRTWFANMLQRSRKEQYFGGFRSRIHQASRRFPLWQHVPYTLMESSSVVAIARGRRLARTGTGRLIRENAGVSVRQLAASLGINPSAVSRWERGERVPSGRHAERYALLLEQLGREG
jgi:DNA-binding XRE family transcriptional regulator